MLSPGDTKRASSLIERLSIILVNFLPLKTFKTIYMYKWYKTAPKVDLSSIN